MINLSWFGTYKRLMGCHSCINNYVRVRHAEYRNDFICTNSTFRLSLFETKYPIIGRSPFILQQLQYCSK